MRYRDLAVLSGFGFLVAITRWPVAPKYLFYFDSVNMALSLEDFDPRKHQPQPPGYPVYVGLCRLIHWLGFSVEDTFLVSGAVAGALACWLLWRLGEELGEGRAGWMAAVLFLFTPIFWFNSLTNQGRGFSAVASVGTAWLALRASRREASPYWLAGAAFFLGTMAGFRPVESMMLAPLLLWAAWKRKPGCRELARVAVAGMAPALIWGAVLLDATGGLDSFITMMRNYAANEGVVPPGTELRPWRALFKMAEFVGAMHLVTLLPWFWALFFARPALHGTGMFLAIWALPGLTFQIVGHAADPGHTLATVAVLCWLGGLTLSRLPGKAPVAGLAVAVALGCALFVHPLRGAARATSYDVIRRVNKAVSEALDTMRREDTGKPFAVLLHRTLVTYRHVRYYFPNSQIWEMRPDGPARPPLPEYPLPEPDAPTIVVGRDGVQEGVPWREALRRASAKE